MTPATFSFHARRAEPASGSGRVVRIPVGIGDERALFSHYARELRFPYYFGFNWDALDECLTDLEWLVIPSLLLWHEDIPLSAHPEGARTYLMDLAKAIDEPGDVPISVSFPQRCREDIGSIMTSTCHCGAGPSLRPAVAWPGDAPVVGRAAAILAGAPGAALAAYNAATADLVENLQDYQRAAATGDDAWITLETATTAVTIQNMTGDYYVTNFALGVLLP